jgi:hypothetical protein
MADLSFPDAVRRSWDRIAVELRVSLPMASKVSRHPAALGQDDPPQA